MDVDPPPLTRVRLAWLHVLGFAFRGAMRLNRLLATPEERAAWYDEDDTRRHTRHVDSAGMQRAIAHMLDRALVFHGYTSYMRDYEMLTYSSADPEPGSPPAFDRYLFRYCVEVAVTTTVAPETWRISLDDRLIDYHGGADLDGYVWGVKWQELYPGARLVPASARAASWSEAIGIAFHEAIVEGNGHKIELVFSELEVTPVQPGYAPFVLHAED